MTSENRIIHYHRRSRVYPSHIIRVFRGMYGGIGIVIWRHEFTFKTERLP